MWEYQELTRKSAEYMARELNEIGQQGWELVSVQQGTNRKSEVAWIAFVKRPYVPHASPPPAEAAATDGGASSHGPTHPAPTQPASDEPYPIDDEEFKLEDLEDELPKPEEKKTSLATEGDEPQGSS